MYAVVRIHKYRAAPRIGGVASGKFIEVRCALVLRAELISVGRSGGLPGMCMSRSHSVLGCIAGFPMLDPTPYGLENATHHSAHGFEELAASLPHLAQGRHSDCLAAAANHSKSRGEERCAAGELDLRLLRGP